MPFEYLVTWRRTHPESVTVEARHRYSGNHMEARKRAFIIGRASGSRVLTLRHTLEDAMKRFPSKRQGRVVRILLDHGDDAAYRIGLAAALLSKARDHREMERGVSYILSATTEEVWFWSSKWLDEDMSEKTLHALAIMSGSGL